MLHYQIFTLVFCLFVRQSQQSIFSRTPTQKTHSVSISGRERVRVRELLVSVSGLLTVIVVECQLNMILKQTHSHTHTQIQRVISILMVSKKWEKRHKLLMRTNKNKSVFSKKCFSQFSKTVQSTDMNLLLQKRQRESKC